MARACTICTNPKASEINEALVRGESHRAVAKQFHVSAPSMFRHQNHLSAVLAKAADVRASVGELLAGESLIQKVRELEATARRITAAAEAAGDPRTALVGLRELARMIELTARLSGQLDGDQGGPGGAPRSITINFPVMAPEQLEAVNNAPVIDLPPMARRLLTRPSDGHQR
jgi:hypothetical protein